MLFSKLKPKSDEFLPPPPPFPSMELEKEISKKKAGLKPKKESAPEGEFEDLFKEVKSLGKKESASKPAKKERLAREKAQVKRTIIKAGRFSKRKNLLRKAAIKKDKIAVKPIKKAKTKKSGGMPEMETKLEAHDFEFPQKIKEEAHGMEELDKEFPQDLEFTQPKPREIQEAEDEIKSAIENIRENEKPSFLKRLFAGKENGREIPQVYEKDDTSAIQGRISKARESLMKFDLDAAKMNYVEAMRIYKRMNPQEQAKVYQEINDLYYERKSAEQLKA